MSGTLPARPDLTHLKNEARQLLRAQRQGQRTACAILARLHRFNGSTSEEILAASVALHESQYALALHYGFASWKQMLDHVRTVRQARPASEPSLVDQNSLAATIDAINEVMFFERRLSAAQKRRAAEFIAARHGLDGAYQGLFAPTEADRAAGYRLFTGERVPPGAGASHILAEESCRALLLLNVKSDEITHAMKAAEQVVNGWLDQSLARPIRPEGGLQPGMFCCMTCSCALWRHLAARKDRRGGAFIAAGLSALRLSRDDRGGWRHWPWHYTLLALHEIGTPEAREEMRYAAQACERELARRTSKTSIYSQRRRAVVEKTLAD